MRFFVFVLFNHTNPQSLFAECRVLKTSYSRATRQSGSKSPSSTRRSKSPATGEKNERDESFNFMNKKRFVQIWANARGTFTCIYLYLVVQLMQQSSMRQRLHFSFVQIPVITTLKLAIHYTIFLNLN